MFEYTRKIREKPLVSLIKEDKEREFYEIKIKNVRIKIDEGIKVVIHYKSPDFQRNYQVLGKDKGISFEKEYIISNYNLINYNLSESVFYIQENNELYNLVKLFCPPNNKGRDIIKCNGNDLEQLEDVKIIAMITKQVNSKKEVEIEIYPLSLSNGSDEIGGGLIGK